MGLKSVFDALTLVFTPLDAMINFVFCWAPPTLRTFSASMLTLTLGAILSISGKKSHLVLKYIIYGVFLLYSVYNLGILNSMKNVSLLDFTAVIFSIIAPICMIIVGKKVAAFKIKGKYKIFNLYTMWLIYVIVAVVFAFLIRYVISPATMLTFTFIYVTINLFVLYISSHLIS